MCVIVVYPTACTFTNVHRHLCIYAYKPFSRISVLTHIHMYSVHVRQQMCTKTHTQEYTCTHIRGFKYSRLPRFPVRFGPNHHSPACVGPKDDIRNPDVPIMLIQSSSVDGGHTYTYMHTFNAHMHAYIQAFVHDKTSMRARTLHTHVAGQSLVASLKSFLQNSLIFQGSFAKVT